MKRPRILLVDDEPGVVLSLQRVLRREGYEVTTTCSPTEAGRLLEEHTFAALVSDQHMPGMRGVQLLSEARRSSPLTTRIMLTGCGDLSVALDALNQGDVFRFLTKPWDDDALRQAIADAVLLFQLARLEHVLPGLLHTLLESSDESALLERLLERLLRHYGVTPCEVEFTPDATAEPDLWDGQPGGLLLPVIGVRLPPLGVLQAALHPRPGARPRLSIDPELLDRLSRGLGRVLHLARQVWELREKERIDSLTGLPNRAQFEERFAEELSRCRRYERQLSLLMLDLDYFKHVNDTRGHAAGDRVLEALGGLLSQSALRPCDIAARLGGDEFAVLLPETPIEGAEKTARRILDSAHRLRIDAPGGPPIAISLSIGVARLDERGGEDLLRRADEALYASKRGGRGRVSLAAAPEIAEGGGPQLRAG